MRRNAEMSALNIDAVSRRAERQDIEGIIADLAGNTRPVVVAPRPRIGGLAGPEWNGELLARIPPRRFATERIIAGNDLTPINYLERGLVAGNSVGRVQVRGPAGRVIAYGSGFLIAEAVLMTNAHVLTNAAEAGRSDVQFRYELDVNGDEVAPVPFNLTSDGAAPIINDDLDIAIVGVQPRSADGRDVAEFGWLHLDPTPGKAAIGEYLTIIQHPNGERKQICVRENKLLKYDPNGPYVWYQTDTVGGSSGSPVFNNGWDVVALHHSGVPRTRLDEWGKRVILTPTGTVWDPSMGDDAIDWFANEGIRISRIVDYLTAVCSENPLAQRVLQATRAPRSPRAAAAPNESAGPELDDRGVLRLNIPIEIRIGAAAGAMPVRPPGPPAVTVDSDGDGDPVRPIAPRLIERVNIDQTDYDARNGYDPGFLGEGSTVALPLVGAAAQAEYGTAALKGRALTYYNYSVVFNADRRLAYYSACNVRSDLFKGRRAEGDRWVDDPRLASPKQQPAEVDDRWYGRQTLFEADRTTNPFDRGHLCARNHLQWGETDQIAKRNGDDSFHFTNCTPQHWQFNQNSKVNGLWFATEDEVLLRTDTTRLCVINGPVFNAPRSTPGADGLWELHPDQPRVPDPIFGGVAIPKQFFKVIVLRVDQELRYLAFVVTQEGLLETIDWPEAREAATPRPLTAGEAIVTRESLLETVVLSDMREAIKPQGLTDGEATLYRVPLSTVASLTGLDFGKLTSAVQQPTLNESTDELVVIDSGSDLTREISRV
jgi:endonuclease G, mitochondrial